MSSRWELVERNRAAILEIAFRHHARAVSVFGSVARGEDNPDSDIDFLIEFDDSASLFDLIDIQDELTTLLACSVDVVSLGGLKERDDHIRREALPV